MNEDSKKVSLAQAVRELRENLPALLEAELIQAKVTRRKYTALLQEGFTEAQALELCKRS